MDVDYDEADVARNERRFGIRPFIVPIDDAHPFDLEAYITSYTGMTDSGTPDERADNVVYIYIQDGPR
jgi:hypothetical protein